MPGGGFFAGMTGVYLVAAELSFRGFTVSPTLRNAAGADLLVTDRNCGHTWSVQVKTNNTRGRFWLVGKHFSATQSANHIYVLVFLKGEKHPEAEYYVVPSNVVAAKTRTTKRSTGTTWYALHREDIDKRYFDGWDKVFGTPTPDSALNVG
jgi:hypothetical protein